MASVSLSEGQRVGVHKIWRQMLGKTLSGSVTENCSSILKVLEAPPV